MSYAHLVWIDGDELESITPKSPEWAEACERLGEAVLRLTCDVTYYAGTGSQRRTHHPFGHTSNAVNYCDEALSTDQRLYLWSGNRLCPLSRAEDDEVEFAEKAVVEERGRRQGRRAV